uniref:TIMP metallopeptidase inhibitor 3 n=1 Tax=Sinocyclocheilus anshuiensis TaxID=1608454 RepID=A0A671PQ63_9TELE
MKPCFVLAFLLFSLVCLMYQASDACSCAMSHPQDAYCHSDIGKKRVGRDFSSQIGTYFLKCKSISVRLMNMHESLWAFIYDSRGLCGVRLLNIAARYSNSGGAKNGKLYTGLCNFNERWERLSLAQKKGINHRYQLGCNCRIKPCHYLPCFVTSKNECLWTDMLSHFGYPGYQSRHYACIQQKEGYCSWYRGVSARDKLIINTTDP